MARTAAAVAALVVLSLWLPATMAGTAAGAGATTAEVTLTVSVRNQSGGPVPDAELTASWDGGSVTEVTANNGKAFLDVEAGADVEISVDHPDYIRNDPLLVENASARDVTVPVYRRGELSVTALDPEGRVADARVIVRKDGRIVSDGRTGDDGRYATGDIERGEYAVTVLKAGYLRNLTAVTVDGDVATRVHIERGSVTLRVDVRDPHFSPPRAVPEATVVVGTIGQVTTLPSGFATVSVPVNTDLPVRVSKEGYETVEMSVSVGESDLRRNVSLSRTPSVSVEPVNRRVVAGEKVVVTVTDEYDEPVANATVLLDGRPVGESDAGGQVAVPVDEPGNHTLTAEIGDLRSEPVGVRAIAEDGEPTATATRTPTATATATGTATTTPVGSPGFTPLTAALAVALAALLARRR